MVPASFRRAGHVVSGRPRVKCGRLSGSAARPRPSGFRTSLHKFCATRRRHENEVRRSGDSRRVTLFLQAVRPSPTRSAPPPRARHFRRASRGVRQICRARRVTPFPRSLQDLSGQSRNELGRFENSNLGSKTLPSASGASESHARRTRRRTPSGQRGNGFKDPATLLHRPAGRATKMSPTVVRALSEL